MSKSSLGAVSAMIFAAGLGTRLGELTRDRPKCLMPVGESTMLELAVERMKSIGVSELVINTHHHADQVQRYVEERGSFGVRVHLSHEPDLLDTGGGLKCAARYFEEFDTIIAYNADIFTELSLQDLVQTHRQERALATLAVQTPTEPRVLLFDDNGLCGWENLDAGKRKVVTESETFQPFGFCGVHVVSSAIFDLLNEQGERFSIIDTYLLAAGQGGRVLPYDIGGSYWIDIGTPEKLAELRDRIEKGL